eukprot:2813890-Pyramimonas_sp.AAC.1
MASHPLALRVPWVSECVGVVRGLRTCCHHRDTGTSTRLGAMPTLVRLGFPKWGRADLTLHL